MIKLVASDLDGTLLLKGAQQLPPELFPLIRKLKELGILFVAASGRQYPNMKRMFAPVADDIGFVSENGGIALYQEEIFYQDRMDARLVREIAEAIYAKKPAEFTCSAKDYHYIMPKTEHFRDLMLHVVGNDCREIQSFDEMTETCMKAAVYERDADPADTVHYWKSLFGDRCTVVTSGNRWVDFIPFETNKAKGLEAFQKKLGIRPEECMTFGDEFNDLAMLDAVPYSFAMAHSKPGVKEHARYAAERVEPVLEKLIAAHGDIESIVSGYGVNGSGANSIPV